MLNRSGDITPPCFTSIQVVNVSEYVFLVNATLMDVSVSCRTITITNNLFRHNGSLNNFQ